MNAGKKARIKRGKDGSEWIGGRLSTARGGQVEDSRKDRDQWAVGSGQGAERREKRKEKREKREETREKRKGNREQWAEGREKREETREKREGKREKGAKEKREQRKESWVGFMAGRRRPKLRLDRCRWRTEWLQ
ncbi:MAG TPA: hypothetical protein VGG45_13195 [Terracidiphilus sp.]